MSVLRYAAGAAVALLLSWLAYEGFSAAYTGAARAVALVFAAATASLYLAGEPGAAMAVTGLGVAAYAAAGGGDAAGAVLAYVAASLIASAAYRVYATRAAGRGRVGCGSRCAAATLVFEVSTAVSVAALSAAVGLAFYTLAVRPSELAALLPGPLSGFWRAVSGTATARVAGLAAAIVLAYYASSRLVHPLLYALAARPHVLLEDLGARARREALEAAAGRTWYHRLMVYSLSTLAAIPTAATVYAALLVSLEEATGVAEPSWQAQLLLGLAAALAGYLASRISVDLLSGRLQGFWRWATLAGAAATASTAVLLSLATHTPLGEVASTLLSPITGRDPLVVGDARLALALARFEAAVSQAFEEVEYIARFIIGILWG